MKIAVTGGQGYLGHHVTKYFLANSLSRRSGFDITDPIDCQRLKDYDVVIHMAALVSKDTTRASEIFRVNVEGTRNVMDALREGQTLIYTSTKDVYDKQGIYGTSKRISEHIIRTIQKSKGIKTGIFRLSTTYAIPTNGYSFVNLFVDHILKGLEINLLMKGKQRRDFMYIEDFSRAANMFIFSSIKNGVYDIGGGKKNSTTMLGLIKLIENIIDKKAKINYSNKKASGQIHYITNIKKVKKELNWKPLWSLTDGINLLVKESGGRIK